MAALSIPHCCTGATAAQAATPPAASIATRTSEVASDSTALDAYLLARAWLDADALPAETSPEARIDLGPTTSVCAILRLDGRLVGAGEAELPQVGAAIGGIGDPAAEGAGLHADAAQLLLRRAVGRAVSKALSDATIDAVRREMGDKVTARLALEIELAGTLRPLVGRTIAEACRRLVIGEEGVAVLRGDAAFRAFPSRMLAADVASRPDRTIAGLLIEAGLPVKDLNQYAPEDRVSLARFSTVRLRGATPTSVPERVGRGGRLIELSEITGGKLEALAGQLATRLAGQIVPRDPQDPGSEVMLLGTLNPTRDIYEPFAASEREAALAVLALARAAKASALPASIREQARTFAGSLARALLSEGNAEAKAPDGSPARDAAATYLLAAAVEELGNPALLAMARERVRFATPDAEPGAKAPAAQGSPDSTVLAALQALALLATDTVSGPAEAEAVVTRLRASVEGSDARLLDAALPLSLILTHPRANAETQRAIAESLAAIGTLARTVQISVSSESFRDVPPDLDGGLMLPGATLGVPDTQCLPLAAALAIAEPRLVPPGEPVRALSTLRFLRFLAQHVATDPWVGGLRNPNGARGLVRASLVGDDCPIGATAAGLLLAEAALSRAAPGAVVPEAGDRPASGAPAEGARGAD